MSHSLDYTNGASLEDCLTNILALYDLTGIKWRRFCSNSICFDIFNDPVLLTYSECISSGVLAAWRRIPNQKLGGYHHVQEENNSLSVCKELWIFWCGDDPDFSRLLKSDLYEEEKGSWESGLSYEGRTLFFRALHNAIERGLLSHGYAKFGKYFMVPQKLSSTDSNRKMKAFSFNFFIHGESTVCSSIDIRLMSPVYILNKCHITAAQSGHPDIKVILCPHGLTGKLTGNCYRYSDPNMARFLNDWNNFFPHHWKRDEWKMDSENPHIVEVLTCGARMKYPISYVFITEEDHLEAFNHHQTSPPGSFSSEMSPSTSKTNSLFSNLLTPPMSPNNDHKDKNMKTSQTKSSVINKEDSLQKSDSSHFISSIKRSVSQECCVCISADKDDDNSLWDFQDPSAVARCVCCRISKKFKKKSGMESFFTSQKSMKNEKLCSGLIKIPFHHQKPYNLYDGTLNCNFESVKQNLHHDASSVSSSSSNLPQLQTSLNHLKNESLLGTVPDAFYAPVTTVDPAMPTLSPQPPVPIIKEEIDCHYLDSSQNMSKSNVGSPQGVNIKGKISEEILLPYHASLLNMFENAKTVSKISDKTELKVSDEAGNVPNITNNNNLTDVIIEKPCLPKRQYEDSEGVPQPMAGILYDYQHLASPLWVPPKAKLVAQQFSEKYNDESDYEELNSNHESKKPLPSVPKDPYEFTDVDETAPSEKGFRPIVESLKDTF